MISVKDIKTFLLSLILVFSVTAVAFADAEKKAEEVPSALPVAAKAKQITGEVKAINARAMSITVTKRCGDKVLESLVTVDKGTKIFKNDEKKTFADIKTGYKVVAKYKEVGGKNIAESVILKPAGPEAKKPETKKAEPKKKKNKS